jgi:hypothetical protein
MIYYSKIQNIPLFHCLRKLRSYTFILSEIYQVSDKLIRKMTHIILKELEK